MGMYKEESLQLLRQKIDLAEVLSTHLDLKRAGSSYKALCPFHDEKTPSFIIHKGDSHYHCFGCGAHGDAIAFLMSYLKMSFTDAVESLAERFQVSLDQVEKQENVKGPSKMHLKEALKEAGRFYHFYLLHTPEGHEALEYLYQRGLDLEFIELFQIGFAPKHPGIFQAVMKEKQFGEDILEGAGLLTQSQRGQKREFFFNRVIFPIKDSMGQIVGFSARKIKEDTFGPKYLNTPETALFKKSQLLYGLSECRKRIAKEKKAILVEGQIDTLRLIQEGFDLTVAGQGTAFTEDHAAELIKLGVQEVFIAFDGDEAGRQAAMKVGDFFQKEGIEVLIVRFEEKEDPDSILREKGPEAFVKYLEQATSYLQFLIEQYSKTMSRTTPSGKHQLVQAITKQIRGWNHPLMVHESLRKLAQLLEVPEHLIQEEKTFQDEVFIKKSDSITQQHVDPHRILEGDFLRWLLLFGAKDALSSIALLNLRPEDLKVPICKKLYEIYCKEIQDNKHCDLLSLGMQLDAVEGQLFLSEILQRKVNGEKAKEGCIYTIQKILERNWLQEREEIKMKIHSGKCSEEEVFALAKRFDELKKQPPIVKLPS
jgi:DNA primase